MGILQLGFWRQKLGNGSNDRRLNAFFFYGFMLYGCRVLCDTKQKEVITNMDLRSRIHSEKSKESLEANMAQYTEEINQYLSGGEEYKKIYFKNHLGRELCNKLYNYDLKEYLPPSSDGGMRPNS